MLTSSSIRAKRRLGIRLLWLAEPRAYDHSGLTLQAHTQALLGPPVRKPEGTGQVDASCSTTQPAGSRSRGEPLALLLQIPKRWMPSPLHPLPGKACPGLVATTPFPYLLCKLSLWVSKESKESTGTPAPTHTALAWPLPWAWAPRGSQANAVATGATSCA